MIFPRLFIYMPVSLQRITSKNYPESGALILGVGKGKGGWAGAGFLVVSVRSANFR